MKNNTLAMTALLAGLLTTSGIAHAAPLADTANRGNIKPADAAEETVESTLQSKIVDERGELLATQPGAVEINTVMGIKGTPEQVQEANKYIKPVNTNNINIKNINTKNNSVNRGQVTPARQLTQPVSNTLQQKIEDERGELLATQPGRVQINESQNQTNNILSQQQNTAYEAAANQKTYTGPLLKGETYGNISPAAKRTQPAPITLQERVKDRVGELQATQPGEIEFQETRRIVAK